MMENEGKGINCNGFSVGDVVNTPFGKGEVWKVTKDSVHVRRANTEKYSYVGEYLYSKYLTNPYHHTQSHVNLLSHQS